MKRIWKALSMVLICAITSGAAFAAPVETVSLTAGGGGTHQGAAAISAAITAVDAGGEVRILEAGNYDPFTINGKTLTVRGAVNGVVVLSNATLTTGVTISAAAAATSVTLNNLRVEAGITDSRAVLLQPDVNALTFNAIDCEFVNTANSNALRVVSPAVAGAGAVNINLTGCDLQNAAGGTYTVTGTATNIPTFNATFDDCNFTATQGGIVSGNVGNGWNYTVRNTTMIAQEMARTSVFRPGGAQHSNNTFTFEDSILVGHGEIIIDHISSTTQAPSLGNRWIVKRCILDNRRFFPATPPGTNHNIHLRYNSSESTATTPEGLSTPRNKLEISNSLILTQMDVNGIRPGGNVVIEAYNNTFFNEGDNAAGSAASGSAIGSGQDNEELLYPEYKFVNNLILNTGGVPTIAATTNELGGNMLVTPGGDDGDLGSGHVYVQVTGTSSRSAVLTAAGLTTPNVLDGPAQAHQIDVAGLVPAAGSQAVNAGLSTGEVTTVTGGRDLRNLVRLDNQYDIGALELGAGEPGPNAATGWTIFE